AFGGARDGESIPEADPGDAIRRAVGVERSIGSVVYAASEVVEPGVIELESTDARLILGEPDNRITPRLQAIAQAVAAGGLAAPVTQEIRREVFGKFLGNAMSGPLCILARSDMATVLAEEAPRHAARAVAAEVVALSDAYGWRVAADPEARVQRSMNMHHKPSILQDLEAGRPMEIAVLYDAPLRMAREAGVPMPVFELTTALARQAARAAGLA
ncbi:MAG TPA: ketopantoate reductase C-terminal domain-containing protein, partial [Acetobacteraceae bacterium]|nr:ketopantoate reductase C-terminal domain-containing protein [Acetobacteraceae bacterium]